MNVTGFTLLALLVVMAFGVCNLLSRRNAAEKLRDSIQYTLSFDTDELFRGEYLYIDQVIENKTDRTIPFLKIETLLPEGLSIVLVDEKASMGSSDRPPERREDDDTRMRFVGKRADPAQDGAATRRQRRTHRSVTVHSAESLWALAPHSRITRRWRVLAEQRGRYTTADVRVVIISHDILGMGGYSIAPTLTPEGHQVVLVLPEAAEWLAGMAPAASLSGTGTVPHGLIHDPMTVAGVRPYDKSDPLNTIDWKMTAHVGSLMVRNSEAIENDTFNIVLNMQSALEEPRVDDLARPWHVEEALTVCASLLDSAIRRNIPVRLISNTPPDPLMELGTPGGYLREDEVGRRIFCSREFYGGDGTMEAYRMLATLPLVRSIPAEGLSDDIIANPECYIRGGNVLFVSAYLDARMVAAYHQLRASGVRVIFYIITTDHHAVTLPDGADIYFKAGGHMGGVGYGF